MLKHSDGLQKIAYGSGWERLKQDWKDGVANLGRQTANNLGTKLTGANNPHQFFTDVVQKMTPEQYAKLQENNQMFRQYDLKDLQALGHAATDPEFGKLIGGAGFDKNTDWHDWYNSNNGRSYIKGQGAWAYQNRQNLQGLKQFGGSPISSMLFGDYNKTRNYMDMLDRYGQKGTAENKYMQGHISADQYKSYQRWRPLLAMWMNIRGWLQSLFTGNKFNAMTVSTPNPNQYMRTQPAPAAL